MKRSIQLLIPFLTAAYLCIAVGVAMAFYLPDSDQRKCYQADSPYAEMTCAGTGQDGAYIQNPLSYTDNGDGTVTDNNTGLVWQKQDDGATFNWYQATGTYDATYNPTSSNACGTFGRLPSKKELTGIVDYAIPPPGPTIHPVFTNTKAYHYWSSTTSAYVPGEAWAVYFGTGEVYGYDKSYASYVRCVRGGESLGPTLIDNDNGTVTDNRTGLAWQQGEPGSKTWGDALSYCEGLNLGELTDWRLPNVKELESLTDDTRYDPAIDTSKFPNAYASYYWSSSTYAGYPVSAWVVPFGSGNVYGDYKSYASYVRCVRGGQSGSFGNSRVTINASVPNAAENPWTVGRFVVTRTEPTTAALSVLYAVSGTATAGSDYQALSGSVTIAAGQTQAEIVVTPIDDATVEGNETVVATISASTTYDVGTPSSATVTITSDDVLPTVTISANDPNATEAGPTTGQFTVTRNGATTTALTATLTVGGTATSGSDYLSIGTSVTIPVGATSATVTVTLIDDTVVESDETVIVTLNSNAAYAVGTPSSATVTITSDDIGAVQFSQAASSGLESMTPAAIDVSLSAPSGQIVTVNYATTNSTATAGSDYTATSGTLTFNPGVTIRTINVPITTDTETEMNETFTVTLTSPTNATLGAIAVHTYTIWEGLVPGLAGLNAIANAVDQNAWTFTSTAGADWWLQPAVTHDGVDAARSGFVADNQVSSFWTIGSFGAGTVSFWWKVSSQPGADLLRFFIDGEVKDTISGDVGWQQKSYTMTAGSHTLNWEYRKDGSGAGGIDAAWVDQVVLPAAMVLWTRGDTGEARLWTGNPNAMSGGVFAVTGQASLAAPSGDGGPWEATSCAHVDASTDYVLWSNGASGHAILAKVNPGASSGSAGDGEPASNLFHSAGATPATQNEPSHRVAQAFLPVRTDRNVCPTGVHMLADRANVAEKYNNGVIPGLTRNPADREMHWIPDEDLGNDGKVCCSDNPEYLGSVPVTSVGREGVQPSPTEKETEWAYVNSPAGDGGPWQATSYAPQDEATGYVLWSRGDTGQAILAKVASVDLNLAGTIPVTSWAYLNPPTGVGGPWQATSYTRVDAATGYVLWSRSDTGQAILWKVAPGEVSGTIPVTSWAYLDSPAGVGEPWQATSYTHIDASEGYVLWTRGDSGQAILWKVVPGEVSGTIPVASWEYVSPREGVGGPWRATGYVHGATPGIPAAAGANPGDENRHGDQAQPSGASGEGR